MVDVILALLHVVYVLVEADLLWFVMRLLLIGVCFRFAEARSSPSVPSGFASRAYFVVSLRVLILFTLGNLSVEVLRGCIVCVVEVHLLPLEGDALGDELFSSLLRILITPLP